MHDGPLFGQLSSLTLHPSYDDMHESTRNIQMQIQVFLYICDVSRVRIL